jgi:hypothetical protein
VKRFLVALMAGTMVFSVAFASAAALIVNGGTIQAGEDTDLVCDSDGVRVLGWGLETDTGLVSFVRVGNIWADCVGADMFANITGAGSVELTEAGPVTIDDSEEILTFDTPVQAALIEDIHIFIEGPSAT